MKRFYIRKKKKTNECDCCNVDVGYSYTDLVTGIGPVNPLGGPDRFDVIGLQPVKKTKRKRRSIKK